MLRERCLGHPHDLACQGKVMILSGVMCHAPSRTQLEQSDADGGTGSKAEGPCLELSTYTGVLGPLFYHLLGNGKT